MCIYPLIIFRRVNKQYRGFSLVELGVVLMIISVILGGGITLFLEQQRAEYRVVTQERMDVIEKALALFVYTNQRLPCPANANVDITSTDFGQEGLVISGLGMSSCDDGNYGDSGDNVTAGAVPVAALGLPRGYMLDGWNRRFMYVVDSRYANNQTTNLDCNGAVSTECFEYQSSCREDVSDAACDTALPSGHIVIHATSDPSDEVKHRGAAYVLLSFGANGFAAYPANGGTRLGQSNSTNEQENGQIDPDFDSTFVQRVESSNFDDIVRYKTKHGILSSLFDVPDESLCFAAQNVIDVLSANFTENHACAGTAVSVSDADCRDYAQAIHSLCLRYYNTIVTP